MQHGTGEATSGVSQGRLHHINDGANAPWKKYGGRFLQPFFRNLGGREDKFNVTVISSVN